MSPRVGMIVALLAAALLAFAIATPWWWSGNPSFDGKQFHRKTANIGLITASQCNYDDVKQEEYECKHLAVGGSLAITKYIQLGITGLVVLCLLGLAFARERRKGVGKLVMTVVAVSTVMGVVFMVLGPNLKTGKDEAMPLGASFIMYFVGSALALVSSVLALLPPRRPRPRVVHRAAAMPAQHPAFDMQALLAEDSLRPAALGPEPMLGKAQSPGGMLPGPAGPLIPPSGPQPLFQAAPQLRPLYEASASGGFVPPPPPVQFPVRGPTPMPLAAVSALLDPMPPMPPPPPPMPKLPPPVRTKPISVVPPIPSIPAPKPRAQPTITSAAVPPPPSLRDDPADRLATVGYEKDLLKPRPDLQFDTSTSETATREFTQEDRTDAGDDLETNAIAKVDPAEVARSSKTDVELLKDQTPAARLSSSIMTSATPPPRLTPMPASRKTPAPSASNTKLPISTAPSSLPPPAEAATTGGPSPACPQCEAPMAWVEEHLRFYCKSCRMYF